MRPVICAKIASASVTEDVPVSIWRPLPLDICLDDSFGFLGWLK